MENTTGINGNNNTQGGFEIDKIKFTPSYSVQYLHDVDLAKLLIGNLKRRFGKSAVSIAVKPVKDVEGALKKGQCPIEIYAQFALNREMFKATIDPKVARLINASEEYELTDEAKTKFAHFLSQKDLERLEVVPAQMNKRIKCTIVSIKLNPYLTLSNCIELPENNVFDIMEIKHYTKHNILMAIRTMKKPQPRNRQYSNNRNHNNNNHNNR